MLSLYLRSKCSSSPFVHQTAYLILMFARLEMLPLPIIPNGQKCRAIQLGYSLYLH